MKQHLGFRAVSGLWGATVLAGLAVFLIGGWGCSDNPSTTLLEPPGGQGGVIGILQFQGVAQAPLPIASITPSSNAASACSGVGAIAVLGSYNGFDVGNAGNYLMRQIGSCVWVFETELTDGVLDFKFVTGTGPGTIAFDTPDDYGKLGANTGADPLTGTADSPAGAEDGNLSVTIPSAGRWSFLLDENTDPATYLITQDVQVPQSSPADGSFRITGLPVGMLDFIFEAEGYLAVIKRDVAVAQNQTVDLGTILMEVSSGSLSGTVAFAGNPDPRPLATIDVKMAGTQTVVQTADTDSAFSFIGLPTGMYDVSYIAPGYLDTTVVDVDYVNGQNTVLDPITLEQGCSSAFNTIQLASEFTSFDLGAAPQMTQGPNCVWSDTVTIAPGTYNMKFVTDGAFDSPLDYGGDESQVLNMPGTFATEPVSGIGTALRISVIAAGDYIFVLDEQAQEFTTTLVGGAPTGSISGTAALTGLTEPLPATSVQLLEGGTANVITTVASDSTGAFSIGTLPDGTYDLSVSAPCFTTQTQLGVVVTGGGNTDAGTITLPAGVTQFSTIQIAGEFTGNFDLGQAPFMTEGSSCVWSDTVNVAAGTYKFKLVTDGAFDNPLDYGGNETVVETAPGTFRVRPASGQGSAISMEFTTTEDFVFTLDERRQDLMVTPLAGP